MLQPSGIQFSQLKVNFLAFSQWAKDYFFVSIFCFIFNHDGNFLWFLWKPYQEKLQKLDLVGSFAFTVPSNLSKVLPILRKLKKWSSQCRVLANFSIVPFLFCYNSDELFFNPHVKFSVLCYSNSTILNVKKSQKWRLLIQVHYRLTKRIYSVSSKGGLDEIQGVNQTLKGL